MRGIPTLPAARIVVAAGYEMSGYEQQDDLHCPYELNHSVELTPDFQYIRRPGGDRAADPVTVVGLRAKVGI